MIRRTVKNVRLSDGKYYHVDMFRPGRPLDGVLENSGFCIKNGELKIYGDGVKDYKKLHVLGFVFDEIVVDNNEPVIFVEPYFSALKNIPEVPEMTKSKSVKPVITKKKSSSIEEKKRLIKFVSKNERENISSLCWYAMENIYPLLTYTKEIKSSINDEYVSMSNENLASTDPSIDLENMLLSIDQISYMVELIESAYNNISEVCKKVKTERKRS